MVTNVCFMCVWNSSAGPGSEEEMGRQRHNRHGGAAAPGGLEKRMEELEKVCLFFVCSASVTY